MLDIPPYVAWDDKANHVVTMYFAKSRNFGAPEPGRDVRFRWVSADELAAGAYPQFNQKAMEYVRSRTIGLGGGGVTV